MGKGIGFQLKKGDLVPADKIQKVFKLDSLSDALKKDYIKLFEAAPDDLIICVKRIIDYANAKFDFKLNKSLFFTLVDHLKHAIERSQKGIVFQNRLLIEIQKYYPKEFEIGCYAIQLINKKMNVQLPEEEAGNIAFHIVNAQSEQANMEETMLSVRALKDILAMLGYLFPEKKVDKDSMLYLRFVTHLQFFIARMIKKEELPEKDDFLLASVKQRFPKEYRAALKIKEYVQEEMGASANQDELLYLTLHISRVY
ncbi:PRD domain-containing protein [Enterococcus faecium]|nr:Transcription antiterminator licT [Enterococcus faecium E4453]BBU65002.1 transcription antiterminator BglG [Enterococcus faecium]BCZ35935.1 transcription antiterminator BglG [Enterococcus faecium]GIP73575.1 transcription antiterminator BglG [Enterococcus faecium]GJG92289.1 transcription antiterminator BglG [Enterococcus faecium]